MNLKNLAMWAIIIFLSVGLYNLFENPNKNNLKSNNIAFSKFFLLSIVYRFWVFSRSSLYQD